MKELRNKARALEVYAKQALNREEERKAAEIRIRAERRAGELLMEMKQTGARQDEKGSNRGVVQRDTPALKDLGISRDQSSQWQQLAQVPKEHFEQAIASDGDIPTTEGIINANILRNNPMPTIDPIALWFWGRLNDFERGGVFEKNRDDFAGRNDGFDWQKANVKGSDYFWLGCFA